MSRHHPVSPFERASFHRRGSAGWDLSGIQAVAPVAQVNLQPLTAQPIGVPQSSYSELPGYPYTGKVFNYVGPLFAVQYPVGSTGSTILSLLRGGIPKFVGHLSVLGRRTEVYQTLGGTDMLIAVAPEGDGAGLEGIRVFDIPSTAPVARI